MSATLIVIQQLLRCRAASFGTWGSQVQILPLRPIFPIYFNIFLGRTKTTGHYVDSYVDRLHLQLSAARRCPLRSIEARTRL
jgi:hypothetical protein